MPAKSPGTIECGCAKKCFSHIPEDRRRALYVGFWNTADFNVQNTYLCGCIKVSQVKRRYTEKAKDSRRGYSREYYVNNGNESVKVCKAAFRSIFAVSDGRINRALKASGAPHTDRRGCCCNNLALSPWLLGLLLLQSKFYSEGLQRFHLELDAIFISQFINRAT